MKIASFALVGSSFIGAIVAAGSCGGDDTSSTTSAGTAGSATSSGAAGKTSGASGSATGGGTTGSGGSSSDSGNGCPARQPAAGVQCNVTFDCTYGTNICSCVDSMWTCLGTPPASDGGTCPPSADEPTSGDPCSKDGLVCPYPPVTCTCHVPEWDCVI